jgi:O-antigen ligase
LISRINALLAPAYLLLCILLGGSTQGIWGNLALQLFGIAILAWAAIMPEEPSSNMRGPGFVELLVAATLLIILLDVIPIPADLWQKLPGRDDIATGFSALGYGTPSLPISQAPYRSIEALFFAIPAVAALVATHRLRASPRAIAAAVIVGMILAIVVGVLQVGGGRRSWAYFYAISNPGAVGFFANRNHMATLLLVGIPMAAAFYASGKSGQGSASGKKAVAAALLAVIALGLILNGSLAAYGLVIPVGLASVCLVPAGMSWRRLAMPIAGMALIGGVALLMTRPIAAVEANSNPQSSISSRAEIWSTTVSAIERSFPYGTGLGSFEQVYHQYENPTDVSRFYVNHAHNDYLEVVLELGLAGAILMILFLGWWAVTSVHIWKSHLSTPFSRAATIAVAAILAHSIVDFPLRTAAISAIFAACVGLMMQHPSNGGETHHGRTTRHVKLG